MEEGRDNIVIINHRTKEYMKEVGKGVNFAIKCRLCTVRVRDSFQASFGRYI